MGEMNPTACQSSIRGPLSGNASECHGFTLPRSFKPHCHEMRACGPFYGLWMAHWCLTPLNRENGAMGLSGAFLGHPCTSTDLLGSSLPFAAMPAPVSLPVSRERRRAIGR